MPEFELNQELEAGEYDILLGSGGVGYRGLHPGAYGGSIEARLTVED